MPARQANIRAFEPIRDLIGRTVVDITQHDADEHHETGAYVCFHFDNGTTVTFPISKGTGFQVETL